MDMWVDFNEITTIHTLPRVVSIANYKYDFKHSKTLILDKF